MNRYIINKQFLIIQSLPCFYQDFWSFHVGCISIIFLLWTQRYTYWNTDSTEKAQLKYYHQGTGGSMIAETVKTTSWIFYYTLLHSQRRFTTQVLCFWKFWKFSNNWNTHKVVFSVISSSCAFYCVIWYRIHPCCSSCGFRLQELIVRNSVLLLNI